MSNELVVSKTEDGLRIALLENKRLVEIHYEKQSNQFSVGDVYIGRVRKILPGLNAAFVDIGYGKDAFLHYLDLGPQVRTQLKMLNMLLASRNHIRDIDTLKPLPDIDKHGKIADVLKAGQPVLVQIMKEAISSKGPRLSSELSLAGQYIILMPFSNEVSVSRKFKSIETKKAVKRMVDGIRPQNMGAIVRTAAEGVEISKLQDELNLLIARWRHLLEEISEAKPPRKVLSEIDRTSSILRDMLSLGFDAIYTDDDDVHKDINEFLSTHQPELLKNLHLKKSRMGLYEQMGMEKQIKALFGRTVNISNGAYLVIEHTEALHVFDVNSGSSRAGDDSPENHALKTNMEAAAEIARQLRLRDMGGIVVIDFIDQRSLDNKRKIFEHLQNEMARDRARHTILPMSRFGLVQLTRQRVRPEVNIATDEACPSCNGTGKIQPSILLLDEVNNNVEYLIRKNKIKRLRISCHPFLAAFLKSGFLSIRMKWFLKYGQWIRIRSVTSLPFTHIRYYDENEEEIKLE